LAPREAKGLAAELSSYYAGYAPLFARREQREWAQLYLRGRLSDLVKCKLSATVHDCSRKSCTAAESLQFSTTISGWPKACKSTSDEFLTFSHIHFW